MKKQIDVNSVIERYKANLSVPEICREFAISKQTLYNILNSNSIALRRNKLEENCGCPLFNYDMYNTICCEDVGDWEHLRLSFKDKELKNQYKKKYCFCDDYINCRIFKIATEEMR